MNNKLIDDELLDLVSENDTVIRTELRSVIRAQNLKWIRAVCGFIINSKGQFWIPRRHPSKKLLPLHLDMSVSGHIQAGETYEQAFFRETQEEVNINLSHVKWEWLLRLTPSEHGTFTFLAMYAIYQDTSPDYNKNDFVDAQWIYPEELITMIEQGEKTKHDLPISIKNFLQIYPTKK